MTGNRKWICAMILTALTLALCAAGKVEISVEPQPVRAGEEAYLVIRSHDGSSSQPGRLPEIAGLRWLGGTMQSSQIRIVNGRRSAVYELKIPFTVSKPGTYTIPSMNLTHSRERTKKLTFEAVEARYRTRSSASSVRQSASSRTSSDDGGLTLEQIMFLEAEIPGRRPFYYLGEEIPLEVNIYVLEGVRPQLTWPKIVFGDQGSAVFRDHRQTNPENPDFAPVTRRHAERNGRDYIVYSFRTAVRPITASKLEIRIDEKAALIVPEHRQSRSADPFDDFFGDSFFSRSRQIARDMKTDPLTVEVRTPPPVPEGVCFTGLVGNWESQITLSPPPYKVGEPITLKAEFQGSGSTDTLRPWPLDLKGFRVYPPEMEKNAGSAEIRYVLIPTEPSEGKTENVFFGPYAVFRNGKYQVKEFRRAIPIARGSAVIPGNAGAYAVETPALPDGSKMKTQEPRRKAEDILYLKKNDGRRVPLPPEVNIGGGLLIAAAGLLFFLVSLIVRLVRRARANDPDYLRKVSARSRKRELLSRLKKMDPGEIPAALSGEMASFLADARGLPPGADLAECAASLQTDSPELAGMLSEVAQAAWMPSMKSRFTPEFRDALVKALSRLALVILLGFASGPLLLSAAASSAAAEEKITGQDQAMNAYDLGKFAAAEKYFRSRLDPAEPSANLLYNIGNCLYQQGFLPQAMLCFERASRLSPRDPDVLENLNLTRRKLMLPEKYKVETPSDIPPYLRDSLRPDEWLLVFCSGIALLFIAGGMALLRGPGRTFRILLACGLLLSALSAAAYFWQRAASYNPDFAVVKVRNLPVYSLPSDQGKVEMNLRPGEEVVIVERRLGWVRIRSGSAEGWVHADAVASLWRADSMADL